MSKTSKKILRWGVLSTAKIGLEKVIPAIRKVSGSKLIAIASRDIIKGKEIVKKLKISQVVSYEELINHPDIDVIYNPLPNHLHVPYSIRAIKSGKHVLCEKPFGLNANEVEKVLKANQEKKLLVSEAFMVKDNPQWLWARNQVKKMGKLVAIQGCFSYFNREVNNIRNIKEVGGGSLYDIGCYLIQASRFFSGEEPKEVVAVLEYDKQYKTDRLVSAMLKFPSGFQASFICSTQMVAYQKIQIYGDKERMEIEVPFNAPATFPCRIFIDDGRDRHNRFAEIIDFPVVDQYVCQVENFQKKVKDNKFDNQDLKDAIKNMKVIDAIFKSGKTRKWVKV